jgi:hypothetical protein
MFVAADRVVRALAVTLPTNLLWVFLACALQCAAASELSCVGNVREASVCCEVRSDEARGSTELGDAESTTCRIVAGQPAVLTRTQQGIDGASVVPAIQDATLDNRERPGRDVIPRSTSPPRPRPLERLPVLLI